jgi:hypothetical protein
MPAISWCLSRCMQDRPYFQQGRHPGACRAGLTCNSAGTWADAGQSIYTMGKASYTMQNMHTAFAPMHCPMCTENRCIACTCLPGYNASASAKIFPAVRSSHIRCQKKHWQKVRWEWIAVALFSFLFCIIFVFFFFFLFSSSFVVVSFSSFLCLLLFTLLLFFLFFFCCCLFACCFLLFFFFCFLCVFVFFFLCGSLTFPI